MPTKREVAYYAMYVICEVESEWNWTSIYYDDPITIGIFQWYGTRAAGLLNRIKTEQPAAYAQIAQSLRTDLETYNQDDTWWNSRNLTRAEGDSIVAIFTPQENHILQETQAIEDLEAYIDKLLTWGFSLDDPKPLIYCMSMYHQSPVSCNRVMQTAGGTATLDRIYQVCMNDYIFGRYKNRYNTVYNRLKAWDGSSPPPDFGQVGTVVGGGDSGGISTNAPNVNHIQKVGDNLILFGDAYPNGFIFYKSAGETWIPSQYTGGAPITGGNTGGGTSTNVQAVVDLFISWVGKFAYSQGGGRLDPLTSGYGDCSSTIWAAYHQVMGIDIGTYTGAQESEGTLIAQGSGSNLPLGQMAAGDLIIFWRAGQGQGATESWHVEMYIGDNRLCGHGGPNNGPTIKDDAQTYCGNSRWTKWMVRRYG